MKSDEDGNNEHVGSWRKGSPCYKVAKNLAELSSSVLWKVEVKSNELGYLAEKISKQSVEVWPGFSLLFIVKCESRDQLKELFSKRNWNLTIWEILSLSLL